MKTVKVVSLQRFARYKSTRANPRARAERYAEEIRNLVNAPLYIYQPFPKVAFVVRKANDDETFLPESTKRAWLLNVVPHKLTPVIF